MASGGIFHDFADPATVCKAGDQKGDEGGMSLKFLGWGRQNHPQTTPGKSFGPSARQKNLLSLLFFKANQNLSVGDNL